MAPGAARRGAGVGLAVEETEDQNGVARSSSSEPTWEDYLAQIPAKLRHEIRRKAKRLEAEAGPVPIETATPATLLPLLDRFVELHRMSEGPKGVFMVPGMEIFFRRLGETLCAPGVFRLTFIRVDEELAAGTIGFRFRGTYSLYNSAFDRTGSSCRPGWSSWRRTSGRRSSPAARVSTSSRATTRTSTGFGARKRHVRRLVVRRD